MAAQQAEEDRALLALRLGQELLAQLRGLDDQAARIAATPSALSYLTDSEPALLTLAVAKNGRLVFPWELRPDPTSLEDPDALAQYLRLTRRGEEAEYQGGRFVEAARLYGLAAAILRETSQGERSSTGGTGASSHAASVFRAEAEVHQARALLRGGRVTEAREIFRQLAGMPPILTDMEGMPFSIYGLEGLQRSGEDRETLVPQLTEILARSQHLSLPALLAWKQLAEGIVEQTFEDSASSQLLGTEESIDQQVAALEALEELREDFPSLLARTLGRREEGGDAGEASWVPYGPEPWLVGIRGDAQGSLSRVPVVRPAYLFASGRDPGGVVTGADPPDAQDDELSEAARRVILLPTGVAGGESLGPALNGLRATFPPSFPPHPGMGGVEGWFFRLLLPVILILTAFTAYLAWRDVRRETEAVLLRSRFVSGVTHELKTPLTSIRMFAETLRLGRYSGPEAQQEYLDTVVHETERLSRLINNVLDFARIDRGEKSYHMAPTDVGAAAREAVRAVAYPLAQGGFTLATDIAEELPVVEADSDALTQALLNLLSNAIKFSGEGSKIALRVFLEEGDVLLQVEDRGKGIAVQDQEAIFRDFYRTADAEEEGIPGTGLGLALVAHVADAHGGRVRVESEVGRGSIFTIRIPVGEAP